MKKSILIFSFIIFTTYTFTQDLILRKDGKSIECSIINIDSVNANFTVTHGDKEIITHLAMDKINKIIYADELDYNTVCPASIYKLKEAGITSYYHNGLVIKRDQLPGLLSLNRQAYEEYAKAKKNYLVASFLGYFGGYSIGFPIGTYLAGGEPQWYLAAMGAGLILISIPIVIDGKSNLNNAIDIYNKGLHTTSNIETEVSLGFTPNGVGLLVNF